MKTRHRITALWIAACIWAAYTPSFSATDNLAALEKLSLSIEKSLDSLQTARGRIQKDGEGVAAQLDVLRGKELLSPGEHRQVEKLLQKSQALASQMEAVNRALFEAGARQEASVDQALDSLRARLSDANRRLGAAEGGQRAKWASEVQRLLDVKTVWESRRHDAPESVPQIAGVRVEPWNGPADIRLKGDRLMDEAEAVRSEIHRVNGRIVSLREEREARRNVSELSRELALFNERDELIGRRIESAAASSTAGGNEFYNADGTKRNPVETIGPESLPGDGSRGDSGDLPAGWRSEAGSDSRDPGDLDAQISRLEKYRRRLTVRADSLEEKASWFYKKAGSGSR